MVMAHKYSLINLKREKETQECCLFCNIDHTFLFWCHWLEGPNFYPAQSHQLTTEILISYRTKAR